MKNITFYFSVALALLIIFSENSYPVDFKFLVDQSTYRCSGGVVSVGDLDRDVREKCGDPLEIGRKQDHGPIWIYYKDQDNSMYYLEILNGRLQRIVSAPCSPDDPKCLDLN
jgi:hypothetical protein